MANNHRSTSLILLLSLLLLLLAACQKPGHTKVGWVGSEYGNIMEARYVSYDGLQTKREKVAAGDTLVLDYDVTVEKGTLTLAIDDPAGVTVWERTLETGGADSARVAAEEGGTYTINVLGDKTGGTLDLSWRVE